MYQKDANEIAELQAQRDREKSTEFLEVTKQKVLPPMPDLPSPQEKPRGEGYGTFSYWISADRLEHGYDPTLQTNDARVTVKDGILVVTTDSGDVEFVVPVPGSYACFIPDAGE